MGDGLLAMDTSQSISTPRWAIQNPGNGLFWSKTEGRCVSDRTGQYTTYVTAAKAEQAIRKSARIPRWCVATRDPAQTRGNRL